MTLYKFQKVNDHFINNLYKSSLYFAKSDELNDPTENMFELLGTVNIDDNYSPDISQLDTVGILSMSIARKKTEESSIESSPYMWGLYGGSLKGFCLVFDEDLFDLENECFYKEDIIYNEFPPRCSPYSFINEKSGLEKVSGVCFKQKNLEQVYKAAFFYKPMQFKQEFEFRLISKNYGLKVYDNKSLLSVIIGDRMSDVNKNKLLSTLKTLGIEDKIKLATVKKNDFSISVNSDFKEICKTIIKTEPESELI